MPPRRYPQEAYNQAAANQGGYGAVAPGFVPVNNVAQQQQPQQQSFAAPGGVQTFNNGTNVPPNAFQPQVNNVPVSGGHVAMPPSTGTHTAPATGTSFQPNHAPLSSSAPIAAPPTGTFAPPTGTNSTTYVQSNAVTQPPLAVNNNNNVGVNNGNFSNNNNQSVVGGAAPFNANTSPAYAAPAPPVHATQSVSVPASSMQQQQPQQQQQPPINNNFTPTTNVVRTAPPTTTPTAFNVNNSSSSSSISSNSTGPSAFVPQNSNVASARSAGPPPIAAHQPPPTTTASSGPPLGTASSNAHHVPPSHSGGHRQYPVDPESQQQQQQQQQPSSSSPSMQQPQQSFGGAAPHTQQAQRAAVAQATRTGTTSGGGNVSGLAAKMQPGSAAQCPAPFVRMTYACAPQSSDLQAHAAVPFGAVFQPLAPDADVPIVNFGRMAIPRCRSCRAYINPFVSWRENGRRWTCCFCNLTNEIASDYYCALKDGERADVAKRPELRQGLVEFAAPSEYMVRAPQPPTFVFLIDVSFPAVAAGLVTAAADAIRAQLDEFQALKRCNFALFTFDEHVHYYSFAEGAESAEMRVMIDVDEPFDAVPSRVVVPLKANRGAVNALLEALPGMFEKTRASGGAAGAALRCAYQSARAIGGKLLLYQCGRVPRGVGAMPDRQAAGVEPHSLLLPRGAPAEFYKTLALDCSRAQLSVDVTLVGTQFSDVATYNVLSQITGGELRRYTRIDAAQLNADLERTATRESGLESVMRVRTSKGLSVATHHGNLFVRSTDLLALPSVDADKAFAVQLKIDAQAAKSRSLALQAALLYTTTSGRRRIRVLTVCLPVVTTLSELFRHANLSALVNLMTKMAIKKALETNLADAREALVNKCIDILAVYRRAFASPTTAPTQLVLPDSLKGLPLAVLALVKCPMLRSGMDVSADERAALMARLRTAPLDLTDVYVNPRLIDLRALEQVENVPEPGDEPPVGLRLSAEALSRDGAYLLDDGFMLRLWIGRDCPPALVDSLLAGAPASAAADPAADALPLQRRPAARVRVRGDGATSLLSPDDRLGLRFRGLLELLRDQNAWLHQPLLLAREGVDGHVCADFLSLLVQDRSAKVSSYYEFLVQIQKEVAKKLK